MTSAADRPVEIANRLRPVLLHLNRHLRREVHTSDVSPGQLSLLGLIEGNPGIGVAELAAREGTAMPSVCSHIDRLEASGLVTRRQAERDRRRVDLEVTPEGERVLKAIRSKRTAWLSARLSRLADTDGPGAGAAPRGPLLWASAATTTTGCTSSGRWCRSAAPGCRASPRRGS